MKSASVHNPGRVLVVGTTPDYIDWIRQACPDRALFLTEPGTRAGATEPVPGSHEEILVELVDKNTAMAALFDHLETYGQTVTGVACFDCESLEMASEAAAALGLYFHSVPAIRNCRDKYLCKTLWDRHQVPCPRTQPINTLDQALGFLDACSGGIVLKPFYGAGSELVFRCRTPEECRQYFHTIKEGLNRRLANPIFKKHSSCEHLMLAEEYVAGPEFSCDMRIEGDEISLIRTAKKIKPGYRPFGTVSGYILPAVLPREVSGGLLEETLLKGARALGIEKGICMVDFVIGNQGIKLIELTPRPGGDCLPSLLKTAADMDMLLMTLDLAQGKPVHIKPASDIPTHIGLRIHADRAGVLQGFNADELAGEKRIKSIHYTKKPGHRIVMPPQDYDSWLLGHMIIQPENQNQLETRSLLIQNRLKVEIAS